MGTPLYMSPEQCQGAGDDRSPHRHLLAGRDALRDAGGPPALRRRGRRRAVRDAHARSSRRRCPTSRRRRRPCMAAAVMKALAKEPRDRFATWRSSARRSSATASPAASARAAARRPSARGPAPTHAAAGDAGVDARCRRRRVEISDDRRRPAPRKKKIGPDLAIVGGRAAGRRRRDLPVRACKGDKGRRRAARRRRDRRGGARRRAGAAPPRHPQDWSPSASSREPAGAHVVRASRRQGPGRRALRAEAAARRPASPSTASQARRLPGPDAGGRARRRTRRCT